MNNNPIKTRADLCRLLEDLLEPLKKFAVPSGYQLGSTAAHYAPKIAVMEGWSRCLWGIGPYTAGGGDARLGQRGSMDDLWTEDKQKRLYEQQVETFRKCPYIAGTTPWILYDFRCPRRLNRYQEGFNRKGLIDADRERKKAAFYVMQRFYSD
jgi:hypothetical protein